MGVLTVVFGLYLSFGLTFVLLFVVYACELFRIVNSVG